MTTVRDGQLLTLQTFPISPEHRNGSGQMPLTRVTMETEPAPIGLWPLL